MTLLPKNIMEFQSDDKKEEMVLAFEGNPTVNYDSHRDAAAQQLIRYKSSEHNKRVFDLNFNPNQIYDKKRLKKIQIQRPKRLQPFGANPLATKPIH